MNSEADHLNKGISKKYLLVIILTVIAVVALFTTFSFLSTLTCNVS